MNSTDFPRYYTFDLFAALRKKLELTCGEKDFCKLGEFVAKGIDDLLYGCARDDVDDFWKSLYESAKDGLAKANKKRAIDRERKKTAFGKTSDVPDKDVKQLSSTEVTAKEQEAAPQPLAQTESPMAGSPGAQLESASGAVSGKFFGCRKNVWLTDDDVQTLVDTFSDLPKKKFTEAANTLSLKFARLASAHKPIPQDHCAELSIILQAMNIGASEEKRLERKEKMVVAIAKTKEESSPETVRSRVVASLVAKHEKEMTENGRKD